MIGRCGEYPRYETSPATGAYPIGKLARPLFDRVGYDKKLHEYERSVSCRMKFWAEC